VPIIDHLEEVPPLRITQGGDAPIVHDDQLGPGQLAEEHGIAPFPRRKRQLLEEARRAEVAHAVPLPAGLVREGASQ